MLEKIILDLSLEESKLGMGMGMFDYIYSHTNWEFITKGRYCANIVNTSIGSESDNVSIPIVRTTTKYTKPVQLLTQEYSRIIDIIMDQTNNMIQQSNGSIKWTNGMIELYDDNYRTMGFHTDQMQDISPGTYICIISLYPSNAKPRQFYIKNKQSNLVRIFPMDNYSVIIMDTNENKQHVHKIISNQSSGYWIGITLRYSQTWITWKDQECYLLSANQTKLIKFSIGTESDQTLYYKMKKNENSMIEWEWPYLTWTISPSDLIKPILN
jgi:hypothetical protein